MNEKVLERDIDALLCHSLQASTTQKLLSLSNRTSTSDESSKSCERFLPCLQKRLDDLQKTLSPSSQHCEQTATPKFLPNQTQDDFSNLLLHYAPLSLLETQSATSTTATTTTAPSPPTIVELNDTPPVERQSKKRKRVFEDACITFSCENHQTYRQKGLCTACYAKARRAETNLGIANTAREFYDEVDVEELVGLVAHENHAPLLNMLEGTCRFGECDRRIYCKSLCSRHYRAARRMTQKNK